MTNLDLGHTRLIIETAKTAGLLRNQLAYVLATAYWETARTMKPVKEAYWLSEAWRKKNLRYYPWYGRGFVQLTWEENYKRAGKILKMDMTTDPNVVMRPKVSAAILVVGSRDGWFTKKKLSDYITLQKSDFKGARRIINGTDKASPIASIAQDYDAALKAEGYGEVSTPEYVAPEVKIVQDAAASDRISTTNVAAGVTSVGGAIATCTKIAETASEAKTGIDTLMAVGPWVIILLLLLAGGWWIWRERERKKKEAQEVTV